MPETISTFSEDEALELAKAAHLQYLNELAIFRPEARANVAWEALDSTYRDQNLAYVRSIPALLAPLGLRVVRDAGGLDTVSALSPPQVTEIASVEHERWCRLKVEQGYVFGNEIDEWSTPKTHSHLRPFDQLEQRERNFPLAQARGLIALVQSCGFEVIRGES